MQVEVGFPNQSIKIYQINKDKFTLGRSKNCDIPIDIDGLSRQHMQVELISNALYVKDLKSTNGIYINNEKIPQDSPIKYLGILPLRVGPLVINIKTEDEIPNLIQDKTVRDLTRQNQGNSGIKDKKSTVTVKEKKVVLKSKTELQMIIFVLLIVAYFSYDYFSRTHNHQVAVPHPNSTPSADHSEVKVNVKSSTLSEDQLLAEVKQANCEETVQNYCNVLGVGAPTKGLGIVIKSPEIFIYIPMLNLEEFKHGKEFTLLDGHYKDELMLSKKYLAPSNLRYLRKEFKLAHFVMLTEDSNAIKQSISINLDDFYDSMDDVSFSNILDRAFILGKDNNYQKSLRSFLMVLK